MLFSLINNVYILLILFLYPCVTQPCEHDTTHRRWSFFHVHWCQWMRLLGGPTSQYCHMRTWVFSVWIWEDTTESLTWVQPLQYHVGLMFRQPLKYSLSQVIWMDRLNNILTRGHEFSKIQISLLGNRALIQSVGRGARTFYSSGSAAHAETLQPM